MWRFGLSAARLLPSALLESAARILSIAYWASVANRRHVVEQNMLPAVLNDAPAARSKARALFSNFGLKLADLWRYEAGLPLDKLFGSDLERGDLERLHRPGKGTLLITPHIGNWEFGAPLLARHGIKLQVITQAEPQRSLTEMRKSSRSRWGIDTIVIGDNPFSFVEVIRRLESGATVALLVDRPAEASAVTVKLFGRKFQASIAAAELARASGCALLPVCLPRIGTSYQPVLLPEIRYERAQLGNREARTNLTQEIMKTFEPVIRQYIDQWYHFIPLWQSDRS
jgi:lauroyl/myristoyl acyltransferase